MVAQVTPFSLNRRGSRLVIDVLGQLDDEVHSALQHLVKGCSEALINLSAASSVTAACLQKLVAALPHGLPVLFCSVPPSVLHRIGAPTLQALGQVLED